MNPACPVCQLPFEREQGYFVGALYIAYAIAVVLLALMTLVVWLVSKWSLGKMILVASALLVPFTPLVFRYSRVVWLHLDYKVEPW